jgi:PAS domain S-box-containing protein
MFSKLNIHNRLALVLWGSALLAFVVGGAGLLLYQSLTLEHRARLIMEPYAQLVAVGTDTAVAFEDPVRAQEILDTLRANPQILEAAIYLDDGRILARFSRTSNVNPKPLPGRPDGIYLGQDTAELLQELPRGARLRLSMGLDQLSQQAHQALWIFGIGVFVLLIGTLAQLMVLRRTIVRPIASLMEATELVRARADYRHRVPASGTDEVARLGQNFNAMMEAIQERENDLHRLTLFQRTILDNVAYGIISATPEGIVTSFNPAAERILGYTADEIIGKQTPACWHDPEEVTRYAQQLSEELDETILPGFEVFAARARRNLPEENEWTFICKDGRRIPVNLSITALRDDEGRITGFVGLGYDLTEHKHAEEEIYKLNYELEQRVADRTSQLEAANRELEAFSYSISHDLRTPLRAIDGFSHILLDNYAAKLDDEGRRLLRVVRDNTGRMAQLIDDMLKFSRTGRVELAFSGIDMEKMARDVFAELQASAVHSKVQLEIDHLPSAWGDSAMMRQVFVNLLSNAIKFSRGKETPKISVGATVNDAETIYFVKDNGVGFNMQYAGKLFGVFQRLHSVNEFEGTGIGLAIVKRIVARHGGRVWAESKDNEGATIYFAFPNKEKDHD